MCLSVMWQWADGASAARESVYFHKSQRSINTEGWLWGWLFSCQVCRVLKAAPTLCCSATRQGIPFHPARIHPITCQQGPLSSETGWKGTKKKKKTRRKSAWLEVDRRTSSSRPEQEGETKLVLQKQSMWTRLRNLSWHATSLMRYLSAPSCKITVCHFTRPWITATNGPWLRKRSEEKSHSAELLLGFLRGLWHSSPMHASQVTPQLDAGVVCLSLRQTWLSRHRGHSVIHPPPLPVQPLNACATWLNQSPA